MYDRRCSTDSTSLRGLGASAHAAKAAATSDPHSGYGLDSWIIRRKSNSHSPACLDLATISLTPSRTAPATAARPHIRCLGWRLPKQSYLYACLKHFQHFQQINQSTSLPKQVPGSFCERRSDGQQIQTNASPHLQVPVVCCEGPGGISPGWQPSSQVCALQMGPSLPGQHSLIPQSQ